MHMPDILQVWLQVMHRALLSILFTGFAAGVPALFLVVFPVIDSPLLVDISDLSVRVTRQALYDLSLKGLGIIGEE
jgi:hypothetical protein